MPTSIPAPRSLKEEVKRALDDGLVSNDDMIQIGRAAQTATPEDVTATYALLEKHDYPKAPDADMQPASVVSLMRTIQRNQRKDERPTAPEFEPPHAHFGGDDLGIRLTPFGIRIDGKF